MTDSTDKGSILFCHSVIVKSSHNLSKQKVPVVPKQCKTNLIGKTQERMIVFCFISSSGFSHITTVLHDIRLINNANPFLNNETGHVES